MTFPTGVFFSLSHSTSRLTKCYFGGGSRTGWVKNSPFDEPQHGELKLELYYFQEFSAGYMYSWVTQRNISCEGEKVQFG